MIPNVKSGYLMHLVNYDAGHYNLLSLSINLNSCTTGRVLTPNNRAQQLDYHHYTFLQQKAIFCQLNNVNALSVK